MRRAGPLSTWAPGPARRILKMFISKKRIEGGDPWEEHSCQNEWFSLAIPSRNFQEISWQNYVSVQNTSRSIALGTKYEAVLGVDISLRSHFLEMSPQTGCRKASILTENFQELFWQNWKTSSRFQMRPDKADVQTRLKSLPEGLLPGARAAGILCEHNVRACRDWNLFQRAFCFWPSTSM